jgi:hypothetical protein
MLPLLFELSKQGDKAGITKVEAARTTLQWAHRHAIWARCHTIAMVMAMTDLSMTCNKRI